MKPARCTLLLGTFISTSLHASGNYVPTIRIIYCINATLIFFTLYGWLSGLRSDSHPYRVKNISVVDQTATHEGKAVPLQARSGPEGSRKLRFPDFVTTAQDDGRLSALRTGRFYPQEILLVLISVRG